MSDVAKASARATIGNELGLHVRAAAMVVRTLSGFDASVVLNCLGTRADAASVLDLLTLAATKGTDVEIYAEGPDAEKAVEALESLIARNFAEE